jgi:exodeoxyribonuclease VII large subunit
VEPETAAERKVYSVAAFNRRLAGYVGRVRDVWVEGEVAELRRSPAWATVFLTLKDARTGACLSATMQRARFDRIGPPLAEGERVQAHGGLQLYEARGELSFRAVTIERVGAGDHAARLAELRRKLTAEGLFAPERKRPLPRFPRAVGLLTGADAAARGDVIAAITTRYPAVRLVVAETRVQGPYAVGAITSTLARLAACDGIDVVILARGGGSFEDLLPFSDERVVRAVATCPVPVVSAVGHEQDEPLCDLAADVRAPTPTAAARLVVPDLDELRARLGRARERLEAGTRRTLERDRGRVARSRERLTAAPTPLLERRRAALDRAAARLQALSPRATLERGYAIVRAARGTGPVAACDLPVLRDAFSVTAGARIEVELAHGALGARVEDVRP